jgi:RNA polymerase sigma-70 factor (family 1)
MVEDIEIRKFKGGDHDAFKKLFDRYSQPLFRFSYSYLKSKEVAEDVVQEVFIKIWDNRESIKTGTSFRSYLFTITLNSIRKQFNKLARLNEAKHDVLLSLSEEKEGFDDSNDYQVSIDKLHELVAEMPKKRREVFIKKKLEDKSLKLISEELGITEKTVEYHITEAMKYLKDEFKKLRIHGMIFFALFVNPKKK